MKKQTQQDLNDVIIFQIDKTGKVAKQYSQKEFDRLGLGITVDQWVLLKIIENHEPLSQKELAVQSLRDPASITRTLDLLEKKNFLRREAIPGNRRQYNISLTKVGNDFVNTNMDMVNKHRLQSTAGFSKKELTQLKEMLIRIQQNLS